MDLNCDWCGIIISTEQADHTFRNYHECLCPEWANYVNKRTIAAKTKAHSFKK